MAKIKTLYMGRGAPAMRADNLSKYVLWIPLLVFASPCFFLIEVFTRENFGERYFRRAAVVRTFTLLGLLPLLPFMNPLERLIPSQLSTYVPYIGWYIYLIVFRSVCHRHLEAQKRAPSVFDFGKYSLSSGTYNETFLRLLEKEPIRGWISGLYRWLTKREVDIRAFECWIEPAPFFVAGLLLALVGQNLGWLLMFSAVTYSANYCFAYNQGDNYVMDVIDKLIMKDVFPKTFLRDEDGSMALGYRTYMGRKPNDPAKRQLVLDHMMNDLEDVPIAE